MKITVVANNSALKENFLTGWGFSLFLEGGILFDTAEKKEILSRNLALLKISPADIKIVVISHDHWDHTGGVEYLLRENPGIKVYVCPAFSGDFKSRVRDLGGDLREAEGCEEIAKGVYTTGKISGEYGGAFMPEQALAVKTDSGLVVLTGCAHPGIVEILEKVKKDFSDKIYLVLGGFHLLDKSESTIVSIIKEFRRLGVARVAPTHCTGEAAERLFRDEYQDDFIKAPVGAQIEI